MKLKASGYSCPQCGSKYCELPVECRACGLTLVSAPHLARSYHHLFPVQSYIELEKNDFDGYCNGCQKKFTDVDHHVSTLYLFTCLAITTKLLMHLLSFWIPNTKYYRRFTKTSYSITIFCRFILFDYHVGILIYFLKIVHCLR